MSTLLPPHRSPHALLALLLGLLLGLGGAVASADGLRRLQVAGNNPGLLPADQAFQILPIASATGVDIEFRIHPGYYLYQDRFHFEASSPGLSLGRPLFSATGEWKQDATFGRVRVHHRNLWVQLPLQGQGRLKVRWQGCADVGLCYPPQEQELTIPLDAKPAALATPAAGDSMTTAKAQRPPATAPLPGLSQELATHGRLLQLALIFVLGLGLAFTPCVLPMLPILAGVIARQHSSSAGRGFMLALFYVLGVATVYATMGFIAGLFGQQINLPALFQHPVVLTVFALLFLGLALSLFGFYELRLPSVLHNRFDALSRRPKGGALIGSYGIGLFSALVVSPCVSAPLLGLLLHVSRSGDAVFGALALFVMALGMGLPLLLLGASEGRLLPRAGAWMNEVKFFFGLLLLVVAASLFGRLLPAPFTLALYGFCAALAGLWLWRMELAAAWRLLLQALGFCLLVYAGSLLLGAAAGAEDALRPLQPLSSARQSTRPTAFIRIHNSAELDAEIARARQAGRAVMLDFYADWCLSCKIMEQQVLRRPDIAARLSRLHLLQADITANNAHDRALLQRFQLLGPPSMIFFDKNGQPRREADLIGEKNARDFLAHLDQHGL